MDYLRPKGPLLDHEFYSEERRRELFPPKPSASANPAPAKPASQPVVAQPSVAAAIVSAVAAAGVPVRTAAAGERDFFTPIHDSEVPSEHQATLAKYRALATEWGVPAKTDICYRVRAGFTLKQHAPKLGPCYNDFQYLQDWKFSDTPTSDCLVFWIPCVVPGSTSKNVAEQLRLLAETRIRLELPSHHLSSFGSAALLSGLILAHFKATGERVPKDCLWVRTDTCRAGGHRLRLSWHEDALGRGDWGWGGERSGGLGGVALGVELGS